MKVLQVCAYAARYGGNFLASLSRLEALLADNGVETEYLFPETARELPWCRTLQERCRVHFAGLNRFSPKVYGQVKAAMADADVIHSHFELYDCMTALAKKKHQKLFWHLHDSFDEIIDLPHRIINKLQYGAFGKRAVLISPNDYYSARVVKWGFPEKQIHHVENAVDFSRLKKEKREKVYDFLVYGGFYQVKGLDILMDACSLLKQRGVQFRLGVVGYPDTWRFLDERYPELKEQICRLEPSEDVSGFYNAAGAFINCSRRECFSYAVLEALYMEKPTIVSRIPGNVWAMNYKTVRSFPQENATALAVALEQQLNQGEDENATAEVADQIRNCYNAARWAQTIKEIYFGTETATGNNGIYINV